jgi:hypothetical protein
MPARRTMGVSEARRLLPGLVESIASSGGRVDITRRGEPKVSLVRTSDLERPRAPEDLTSSSRLDVEFSFPPEELVEVVRELRSRLGRPRALKIKGSSGQRGSSGRPAAR